MRALLAYLGMLLVGALLAVAVLGYSEPAEHSNGFFPPCATEDSWNCYWDGANRGNKRGYSFINIGDETTIYLGWTP